jgi:hypothetical protein
MKIKKLGMFLTSLVLCLAISMTSFASTSVLTFKGKVKTGYKGVSGKEYTRKKTSQGTWAIQFNQETKPNNKNLDGLRNVVSCGAFSFASAYNLFVDNKDGSILYPSEVKKALSSAKSSYKKGLYIKSSTTGNIVGTDEAVVAKIMKKYLEKKYKDLTLSYKVLSKPTKDVYTYLKKGYAVVICVGNAKYGCPDSKFTTGRHYITLLGYNDEGKIYISNSNYRTSFLSTYSKTTLNKYMTSKVYKDGKVHAVAYKCTWK